MLKVKNQGWDYQPEESKPILGYTSRYGSRKQPNYYHSGKNYSNKNSYYKSTNQKPFTSKKGHAVRKTHERLKKTLREFNIRHVKKVFGKGLVRVCCRTYDQIANIIALIRKIAPLIQEIGMPLQCACNMKSIVLFIKPFDIQTSPAIEKLFQTSICGYNVRMIDIEDKIVEKIIDSQESGSDGDASSAESASGSASSGESSTSNPAESQNEAEPLSTPEMEPSKADEQVLNVQQELSRVIDVLILGLVIYSIFTFFE